MLRAELYCYRLPLQSPLNLNGKRTEHREGLILRLVDAQGEGFGEAAPLPGFSPESSTEAAASLQALVLANSRLLTCRAVASDACKIDSICASAQWAFDSARQELLSRQPMTCNGDLEICRLVQSDNDLHAQVAIAETKAVSVLKVKVGRASVEEDVRFLNRAFQLLPATTFRLDANRAWSLSEAEKFCHSVDWHRIAFLEEPCKTLAESEQLCRIAPVKLALDESLRERRGLTSEAEIAAFVIKPGIQPGGLAGFKQLLTEANKRNAKVIVSSSYQSSLGVDQLAFIAQNFTPDSIPGLDTLSVFSHDVIRSCMSMGDTPKPLIPLSDLTLVWRVENGKILTSE